VILESAAQSDIHSKCIRDDTGNGYSWTFIVLTLFRLTFMTSYVRVPKMRSSLTRLIYPICCGQFSVWLLRILLFGGLWTRVTIRKLIKGFSYVLSIVIYSTSPIDTQSNWQPRLTYMSRHVVGHSVHLTNYCSLIIVTP
jgi:hypothetical protein